MRKKIIVIGAGPAGLTAAEQLQAAGYQVTLFESTDHVGGLARSFELWGQTVDCGPHRFFSNDPRINNYFKSFIGDDYTTVNRLTRIFYRKRFFFYPLQAANALSNLPFSTVVHILWSYAQQRLRPINNPSTFEEWVVNKFGRKLFSIFFKNYSEKLWGIPCAKIDAEWAAQRIKKLSLWEALKSALLGNTGNKHKTLVDQFAYPKKGSGELYQRIANKLVQDGGDLRLRQQIRAVEQNESGKVIGVRDGEGILHEADMVISTMPITHLVKGLQAPVAIQSHAQALYFRNTILVYVEVDAVDLFPDNWIYVHSDDVLHGRITNFRNWSKELYGDKSSTILCLEYWCFDQDEIWQYDADKMGALAEEELRKMQLLKSTHRVLNTSLLRVPKCYPVYETGYQQHLQPVQTYLDTVEGLLVIGRYGAFKYNNQDHSILMGLLAAAQIKSGRSQNLWRINTDDEYQEEGQSAYQSGN